MDYFVRQKSLIFLIEKRKNICEFDILVTQVSLMRKANN